MIMLRIHDKLGCMRLSGNTLLVALACFALSSSTAEAAISRAPNNLGIVGYWSFDDCKLNKATDSSGYGNTGTLTNFALSGATSNWTTAGKRGCALDFDGTNDYINAGSSSTYKPADITISLWAKYNALTEFMIFSGNNADWGNYTSGWVLEAARTSAGTVRPAFFTGAGNYIHSTQPVSVGKWYHIVGTYNSTSNVASIYVDGVRTSTTTNADIPYGSSNLIIGSISGDRYFFNGSIDEYRIYNRALSANEVTALYNTGAAKVKASNNTGLVGYWSFDDCKLTKATDSSGYGNIGTLTNFALSGATSNWLTGAQAKRGCALSFDGTDDYVNTGSSAVTQITNSPMTVSAWVKPQANNSFSRIVTRENHFIFGTNSGQFMFGMGTGSGWNSLASFGSDATLVDGAWQHVVAVYDGSSARGYVNGVDVGTVSAAMVSNTNILAIGWDAQNGSQQFAGSIDEVRIYNRALSANEVASLYNASSAKVKAPNNLGLVGYWSFDDCKLNKATDSSGYGNTGTLTNFALSGATSNWMTGAQAKRGCALNFDGTNDYVDIGVGSSVVPAVPHTVAFWFKMSANNDGFFLSTNSPKTEIYYAGNIIHFSGSGGTAFNLAWAYDTNWHHVVWTDAGSGTYGVYLDGVAKSSSGTGGTISQASFRLGAGIDTTGYNLQGFIDEVRIYNRALSANEVRALYNAY